MSLPNFTPKTTCNAYGWPQCSSVIEYDFAWPNADLKGAVSILFPVYKPTNTPAAVSPAEPVINKVGILIGLLRHKEGICAASMAQVER